MNAMSDGRLSKIDSDTTNQKSNLSDSLNIHEQFYSYFSAYSSAKNALPSNGESHSDNLPQTVNGRFAKNGFYLRIEPDIVSVIDSQLSCKLYVINTSHSKVNLEAQDSRLNIIAEALDENNVWQAISYFVSSDCGNSYHKVVLDVDEYWSFDIPVFKGTFKTKLRYTLNMGKDSSIHSNEVDTRINKGQFNIRKY